MSLEKITVQQMDAKGVCSAPDVLSGTPAQNKAVFDRMMRELFAPAYNAAVDAINAINQTESGIEAAEALRVSAENLRVQAETARIQAESGRVTAEQARVNAENLRVEAENLRQAAETARAQAESGRATAEQARESAEATRVANENQRIANENARIAAEQARVSETTGVVAQAAEQAEAAAESARLAAQAMLGQIPDGSFPESKLVAELQAAIDRAKAGGEIDITLANKVPRLGSYTIRNSSAEIDAALNGMMSDLGDGNVGFCELNIIIEGLDLNGGTWLIRLHKASDAAADVIATKYDSASIDIMARSFYAGVWNPWEHGNPPMKLGVEYRTTERWLEYPVYVKVVDFGAMTNGKSVEIVKNPRHVVRCSAVIGAGTGTIPVINPQSLSQSVGFTANITQNDAGERVVVAISQVGTSWGSDVTATVAVWYTKY